VVADGSVLLRITLLADRRLRALLTLPRWPAIGTGRVRFDAQHRCDHVKQTEDLFNDPTKWCDGGSKLDGHEVPDVEIVHRRIGSKSFSPLELVVEGDEDRRMVVMP
jgi:hypothetical protein